MAERIQLEIVRDGFIAEVFSNCKCAQCMNYRHLFTDDAAKEQMAAEVAAYKERQRLEAEQYERERQERIRRDEEARLLRIADEQKAYQKSKELFLSLLTPEEQDYYKEHGSVRVRTNSGQTITICEGYSGNVIDGSNRYCCYMNQYHDYQSYVNYPFWDHMIAQLVNLRWNDEYFFQTACY